MADGLHAAAPHHLPGFIADAGGADPLIGPVAVILLLSVVMIGGFFFKLHSLPERMAHKTNKVQMEIVAVLCLISLFTHIHLFWIIALLLALVQLPDISNPVGRIAGALETIAGRQPPEPPRDIADEPPMEDAVNQPAKREA